MCQCRGKDDDEAVREANKGERSEACMWKGRVGKMERNFAFMALREQRWMEMLERLAFTLSPLHFLSCGCRTWGYNCSNEQVCEYSACCQQQGQSFIKLAGCHICHMHVLHISTPVMRFCFGEKMKLCGSYALHHLRLMYSPCSLLCPKVWEFCIPLCTERVLSLSWTWGKRMPVDELTECPCFGLFVSVSLWAKFCIEEVAYKSLITPVLWGVCLCVYTHVYLVSSTCS